MISSNLVQASSDNYNYKQHNSHAIYIHLRVPAVL